jgi:DHA1 family tetracycline resistance protein-like MFS transporter
MRFILVTVLIDMLSIGLIVPVLPALIGKFSADPAEQAHWVGVVFAVFSLASFVATPVLGALSDRYGRRPLLLIGFCGLAVNFFATAWATSLWMLVASRVIGGGMQANAAVAQAYVADISAPEERTKRFGALGAMFGIGFILGPAMGGTLGAIDIHLPFYAAGGLALLNLAYGYFVLPESLPPEKRRAVTWSAANPLASILHLVRLKGVGPLVGVLVSAGLLCADHALTHGTQLAAGHHHFDHVAAHRLDHFSGFRPEQNGGCRGQKDDGNAGGKQALPLLGCHGCGLWWGRAASLA